MENMPPGYRFYPTEEELVSFYLRNRLDGAETEDMNRIIPVVDIYEYNPWDLPQVSGEANLRDTEQWFFFIPRQESEARGGRPKRLTTSGYWKATGSPSHVYSSDSCIIGMKRTMVFYSGRAPSGKKTDWKMNEYKAIKPETSSSTPMLSQEFSLCRVYKKSKCIRAFDRRPAPRNVNDIGYHPIGIGSVITVNTDQKGESGDHQKGSTSYHNNNNNYEDAQRESSSESLSSGEQGEPSHRGEGSQMDIESELLLDWDHLDLFLVSDQP